jgi:hypothetical protein
MATASIAMLVFALLPGGVAHAHDVEHCFTYNGLPWPYKIGCGGVSNAHTEVFACDHKADGRGVWVDFIVDGSRSDRVSDGNGSASGCGRKTVSGKITQFSLCLGNPTRCGEWYSA